MAVKGIPFDTESVRGLMTCAECGTVTALYKCPTCGGTERVKTQTRRVTKPQPEYHSATKTWRWHFGKRKRKHWEDGWLYPVAIITPGDWTQSPSAAKHARYAVGDILYVREALFYDQRRAGAHWAYYLADRTPVIPPDSFCMPWRWKRDALPAMFMPKRAARLWLRVTDVRAERLQEISHEDALAEGCQGTNWVASSPYFTGPHTDDGELPVEEYERRWDAINAKRGFGWDVNPWLWRIVSEPCEPPEGGED